MKVLIVGSGGREHALAWAVSGSKLPLQTLYRTRQSRHRTAGRECRHGRGGCAGAGRIRPLPAGRPGDPRPGSAARGGAGGRAGGARHTLLRPDACSRATGRQQGVRQGDLRGRRHPHRALGALRGGACRPRFRRAAGCADRGQGGRAGGRKGRGGGADRGRGEPGDRRHARRALVGRGRRQRDHRGMPGWRRGQPVRALRWHGRGAAGRGPGPQAHFRRRPGPQHRRHGRRLPAGALPARSPARGARQLHPSGPARNGRHAARRSAASCSPA